jgi:hypothetical protein
MYKISDGYQIQVFDNKNYNDDGIGNSIWLPIKNFNKKNDKYRISDLEPKYRNFNSFKIMTDNQANIQKSMIDCILKGVDNNNNPVKDLVCSKANDYNTTGRYNRKIFIERKASNQGKECIYTNKLTGEGESISDIYDTKDNTYSPQPNDCKRDCVGNWSKCDERGLKTYKITHIGEGADAKECPYSNGIQTKYSTSNSDGIINNSSNLCTTSQLCNWPAETNIGTNTGWVGNWIASPNSINSTIYNILNKKSLKILPAFKITNWGCDLYLRYSIGTTVFENPISKRITTKDNPIGIKAFNVDFNNNIIEVDLSNNKDNINPADYGLQNTLTLTPTIDESFICNNGITYTNSSTFSSEFSKLNYDCIGTWSPCNSGGRTFTISHPSIGKNGKPCTYTDGLGNLHNLKDGDSDPGSPPYCQKSAKIIGYQFWSWNSGAWGSYTKHYSHKRVEQVIHDDITNFNDWNFKGKHDDNFDFFMVTEIKDISNGFYIKAYTNWNTSVKNQNVRIYPGIINGKKYETYKITDYYNDFQQKLYDLEIVNNTTPGNDGQGIKDKEWMNKNLFNFNESWVRGQISTGFIDRVNAVKFFNRGGN